MENQNNLDANKDVSQLTILQKINNALAEIGGRGRWLKAPEFLPEYEPLKGKKIVIVEDVKAVIENILPEYIVATDGSASAVLHAKQNLEELVSEILSKDPNIVLMDYNLANEINGVKVINEMKARGYTGQTVGHSSESREKEFERAGAIGCVDKTAYPVSDSIKKLVELIGKK